MRVPILRISWLSASLIGCTAKSARQNDIVASLHQVVRTGQGLPLTLSSSDRSRLEQLYQENRFSLIWLDRDGSLRRQGRDALAQLKGAEAEGLRPADYAATRIDSLIQLAGEQDDAAGIARADAALSAALLRYLQHLHVGRVNPRRAGIAMDPPQERHDYVALLTAGLRRGSLQPVITDLAPRLEQYRLVHQALTDLRRLVRDSVPGHLEDSIPLATRIHQLELALERLRWISDLADEPFILVNIPMFELTAWRSPSAPGAPEFRTGVIVGKALDTETPALVEEMRYLVFQPYWNIPASIAKAEILPALERDRGDYLVKNNMEIVEGQSDDAAPVPASGRALKQIEEGVLRIRQRPGPRNALGPVKFIFPNDANVYLHGTPAQELFDRARRDFSHGCVRVEDPGALAEWVLREDPEWDRVRIEEAMLDRHAISLRVNLPRPLTVVLFYSTAFVEADGTVRFARDIYRHDQQLDQALRALKV